MNSTIAAQTELPEIVRPVPRLWPGETIVCAASGPSLTREMLSRVRGRARLIAVNNTWAMAPWADALYAADAKWWRRYRPDFAGLKFSAENGWAGMADVVSIPGRAEPGLCTDPAALNVGIAPVAGSAGEWDCENRNSGYQAINLAYHLGAARILLLGYDMKPGRHGRMHHHGDHAPPFGNPTPERFAIWRASFPPLAADLARQGVEAINCTPGSALDCFSGMPLETALARTVAA